MHLGDAGRRAVRSERAFLRVAAFQLTDGAVGERRKCRERARRRDSERLAGPTLARSVTIAAHTPLSETHPKPLPRVPG